MITTITLNAAIDKTYYLESFKPGQTNRVADSYAVPGGKGINVARVAHTLGQQVTASGFVGGKNGEFIIQELNRGGITNDFVTLAEGESRLCLNVLARDSGQYTEILESGPVVTTEDVASLKQTVARLAARSSVVTLSGSLPKGVPVSIYRELIEIVKGQGAKAFLDTSGAALSDAVTAKPAFIKPNEDEIETLLGQRLTNEQQLLPAIKQLMETGIGCVVVTMGEHGAVAGFEGRCYRIQAPVITAVNPVGCGDSFVAGMAVGVHNGWPWEEQLRYATATASANALTPMAGTVRPADLERLLPQVTVHAL
ncbi:1-phosphofructokinase [Paenibacillaceae bacterium]|nr:1-phosphofructokinase [Paenibacillaceae bacterium]